MPRFKRSQKVAQVRALHWKYGPFIEEIKSSFYSMDRRELDSLFEAYGEVYGRAAQAYAEDTYELWRAGKVKPSAMTLTKLLDLVPQHVSVRRKYELVSSLRSRALELARKNNVRLTIRDGSAFSTVLRQCITVLSDQRQVEVPSQFFEVRTWVAQNDTDVLQRLAADLETEAHRIRVFQTLVLLPYVLQLREVLPVRSRLTMTLTVPTVRYTIDFERIEGEGTTMMDQDILTAIQRAETDVSFQRGDITLHEHLLRNLEQYLTPEQVKELTLLAGREAVDLDGLRQRLMIQSTVASRDIEQFQALIQSLRQGNTATAASGTFKTASGEIRIETKKRGLGCLGGVCTVCAVLALIPLLV